MTDMTQLTERAILHALVLNLSAAGYMPAAIWTEEDYVLIDREDKLGTAGTKLPERVHRVLTLAEVESVFRDYDLYAPTIHFTHKDKLSWGTCGVMVVPGNGVDFISDWHCGDAAFDAIVSEVANAASEGAFSMEVRS